MPGTIYSAVDDFVRETQFLFYQQFSAPNGELACSTKDPSHLLFINSQTRSYLFSDDFRVTCHLVCVLHVKIKAAGSPAFSEIRLVYDHG